MIDRISAPYFFNFGGESSFFSSFTSLGFFSESSRSLAVFMTADLIVLFSSATRSRHSSSNWNSSFPTAFFFACTFTSLSLTLFCALMTSAASKSFRQTSIMARLSAKRSFNSVEYDARLSFTALLSNSKSMTTTGLTISSAFFRKYSAPFFIFWLNSSSFSAFTSLANLESMTLLKRTDTLKISSLKRPLASSSAAMT